MAGDAGASDKKREVAAEFVLNETMQPGEEVDAVVMRMLRKLRVRRGTAVHLFVFGKIELAARVEVLLNQAEVQVPLTWVEGQSCNGAPLAGLQLMAVEPGCAVDYVRMEGRVVAATYHDGEAEHCVLGGIGPREVSAGAGAQTRDTLEMLDAALHLAGFALEDVARTWFYNDDILSWYDEFNRVRTTRYALCKFSCGSLPASTAVSGRNPAGAALTLAAWAVKPGAGACVREVASPLQCPAPQYGSSFSRATAIESGGVRRLLVSGTASIEPGGRTVHLGDVPKQVELSMQVIAAILETNGMSWADVQRASAYCKRPEYVGIFREWQHMHGQETMPVVPVHCDICRDDLLFELELDAVKR